MHLSAPIFLFFSYYLSNYIILTCFLILIKFSYSPRSGTSSNASTPSTKKMEEKPTTPISKSVTPTSGGSGSSAAGASGLKPIVKPPTLGK